MASTPLKVAILWHQHQPYYKLENRYLLPWARLHATKDYFDIIATLDRFPTVRQTVNVVPSLLIQLIDYVENGSTDVALELSRRPAADLDEREKLLILRYFFLCNVERMILPYPRYAELYRLGAGAHRDDAIRLEEASASMKTADWLDLQVWYNLTWIGQYSREEEPFASLLRKGSGFTEEEKHSLLDASIALIGRVVPLYKRLMESGQIELSVTPFYHPILPLLCDSYAALEALPNMELPEHHIQLPEDAALHIRRAVDLYRSQFGVEPRGLWPSEGSVSDQALALVREAGITWAATDEGVLRRSLGESWDGLAKYFPYTLKTRKGPLWMLFRDHELSDAIGFVYSNWKPQDAALDFYNRLVEVRNKIIQERGADALADAVVPVILDGENCWEYYEENGQPFLEALYKLFSESNEITTTTISAALEGRTPSPARTIGRIYAGSWIGTNFKIWIGHDEDNRAWDALIDARHAVTAARGSLDEGTFAAAMEEIYICEGSDWFWWFGDENSTANQDDFDDLFRAHLRNVYRLIGQESPPALDVPIRRAARTPKVIPPVKPISPTVDGRRSSDFEWENAGHFVVEEIGGAMHRADAFERRVWFGSNETSFFVRFDTPLPMTDGVSLKLTISARRRLSLYFRHDGVAIESPADENGRIEISGVSAAVAETLEAAIPLALLGNGTRIDAVGIVCEIFQNAHEIERFPQQGEVRCELRVES